MEPTNYWTSKRDEGVAIRMSESGPGSARPVTVIERFQDIVKRYPSKAAITSKTTTGTRVWTWKDYYDDVLQAARSLIHLGLEPYHGVGIIGFNSPEWFISDLAAIFAGGIAVGIYTTNNAEACQYVAEHADCQVVVVENEVQLKKFLAIRSQLPALKKIVQWSGIVAENYAEVEENLVISWETFMKLGDQNDDEILQKRMAEIKPNRCCTLIYTSGTTGQPKAVMISHDNATWTASCVVDLLNITENDICISYLPLSHIAAQMLDVHGPMAVGVHIHFARPDALKGSLVETLREVRPTMFLGVPRVWEKIQEKMLEVGKTTTGWRRTVADWAKSVGLQGSYAEQRGESKPWGFTIANSLVFSKVKVALGLDRVRYCASAAAPIAKETLDYFMSLYIPIFEIYGMSECSGPQTVNFHKNHKTGTAGVSIPASQLKIVDPDRDGNGEICYTGRHIFMGYMKNEQATREAIDADGFLHSGDIGKVDKDGFLSITGRLKEILITAGGENIPPVLIEDEIKKEIGWIISNVMVVGDRKKFLSAVVTLKAKPIKDPQPGEYPFTNELVDEIQEYLKSQNVQISTVEDACNDPVVRKAIETGIVKANKRATSNAQVIQKFVIVPKDFTIETNELTPTLKLKRRIVIDKYGHEIDKMYAEAQ